MSEDQEYTSSDGPAESDSSEIEYDDPTANDDVTAESTGSDVLLVKDCAPWQTAANETVLTELGVSYDVVRSSWLEDVSMGTYSAVILPSTQPARYYENVRSSKDTLSQFVSDGGTLVAHLADDGWDCTTTWDEPFVPGSLTKTTRRTEYISIEDGDSPIVERLTRWDLYWWTWSTHGYFRNVPDEARTIISYWGDESRPTYVEYEYGDGRVLATMQPLEWPFNKGNGTRQLLQNELEYAVGHGPGEHVSSSVTTLQFIPGKEENPSRGGDPLNSGLMQMFPEDKRWGLWGLPLEVNADPVMDSWIGGDMIDELPEDLDAARRKKPGKYLDDVGRDPAFNQYRFENGVSVSFDTAGNNRVDKDTIKIQFNEAGPSGDDPVIIRGTRESSQTVLHDDEINGIPWEEWYGDNVRSAHQETRYYEYDTEFEFDGVEGVRVVTVWGGWAGFMKDVSTRAGDDTPGFLGDIWDWGLIREALFKRALMSAPGDVDFFVDAMTAVPRTWTFIDFIVLADGRRYARVWDASQYPSLYTYMDGSLKARENMEYEPKQLWNKSMLAFHMRAILGATPYNFVATKYYEEFVKLGTKSPVWERILLSFSDQIEDLDVGWAAHEFMPTIPRVTLGYDSNGVPIDDANAPFPLASGLAFPFAGKLPPN